jgi:hypothetical protein
MSELAKLSIDQISRDGHKLEISLTGWRSYRSARRSVLTFSDDAVVRPVALIDIRLAQSKSESGTLFRQLTGNQATGAPISEYHFPAAIQKRALLPGMTAKFWAASKLEGPLWT